MTHDKSPFKQVLDLALFGPVGLALSAKEAIPDWVDKGRTRVVREVGIARMVGEHATRHGQRVVTQTLVGFGVLPGPPPPQPRPAGSTVPSAAAPETRRRAAREAREGVGRTRRPAGSTTKAGPGGGGSPGTETDAGRVVDRDGNAGFRLSPATSSANGGPGPRSGEESVLASAELAIPGYDSLSASQVVQRLAGLAPTELEAVRTYEAAGRGRRTILTKISQLQTGRA